MRRHVVADVLRGDLEAVLGIVHQGLEAVMGGDCGGVDAEGGVVGGAENQLFAPVAEQVAGEAGATTEGDAFERGDFRCVALGWAPFADRRGARTEAGKATASRAA